MILIGMRHRVAYSVGSMYFEAVNEPVTNNKLIKHRPIKKTLRELYESI